jgi:hypothetical protein
MSLQKQACFQEHKLTTFFNKTTEFIEPSPTTISTPKQSARKFMRAG